MNPKTNGTIIYTSCEIFSGVGDEDGGCAHQTGDDAPVVITRRLGHPCQRRIDILIGAVCGGPIGARGIYSSIPTCGTSFAHLLPHEKIFTLAGRRWMEWVSTKNEKYFAQRLTLKQKLSGFSL